MRKKIFILGILALFSSFLYSEKKSINVEFRLYKALPSDGTSVYVRWLPKKVETPNLTYFFTANIENRESPEEKEIKKIFNIKELECINEGKFVISFDPEELRGKSEHYMMGYWDGYYGIRHYLQANLSDGKKYEFRLIPSEPKLDTKRFRFQIYEPPIRKIEKGSIGATTPDKFYLDVEFLLPQESSTVIGFVDSKDTPYFASFRRVLRAEVQGVQGGVVGGVVGGIIKPKEETIKPEGEVKGVVGGVVGGVIKPETPDKEKKKEPLPIKEGIKPPKLIKKVEPVYPENCVKEGIEGVVILEATTDEEGNVAKVEILRPVHPDLDKAAIEAVKQWKYAPFIFEGEPRAVVFTVTVSFKLAKDKKEMEEVSYVNIVFPEYPKDCPEKVKGLVEIKANVDKNGNVTEIALHKSLHPCLDRHAMEKVKKWIETEDAKNVIKRASKPGKLLIMIQFMPD